MTQEDEEMNVKICKVLGIEPFEDTYDDYGIDPERFISTDYVGPDYCNDLNAMHNVWRWLCVDKGISEDEEKLIWEGRRTTYGEHLEDYAISKCKINGGALSYVLSNLTAKEKAKCFLSAMKRS